MPKIAEEMGALAIRNLKHTGKTQNPERYSAGGVSGLMIQVTPNNAKSWVLRTTIGGKRRFLGLGAFPEVSLKQARDKAAEKKQLVREGVDPMAERRQARAELKAQQEAKTFEEVAYEYAGEKLKGKNEKNRKLWVSSIKSYALPVIGNIQIDHVETEHILKILRPLWHEKTETAQRLSNGA